MIIILDFGHLQPTKGGQYMAERVYRWFLEPKTGEGINGEISGCCSEENFGEKKCADGESHKLWEVTKEVVDAFVASRRLFTDFEVWSQQGKGAIKNVSFLFRSKNKFLSRPRKPPVSQTQTQEAQQT